jgi:hypothetical protein
LPSPQIGGLPLSLCQAQTSSHASAAVSSYPPYHRLVTVECDRDAAEVIFFIGVPLALNFGILSGIQYAGTGVLEAVDFVASNLLLPISAFLVSLFVGWSCPPAQAGTNVDLAGSPLGRICLGLAR